MINLDIVFKRREQRNMIVFLSSATLFIIHSTFIKEHRLKPRINAGINEKISIHLE